MYAQSKTSKIALLVIVAIGAGVVSSVPADPIFFEDFEDDYRAGRMVPDTVVGGLSTAFTSINNHNWGWGPSDFLGFVCLRDRNWETPGGEGGGGDPIGQTKLDICGGYGGYFTLRFPMEGTDLHVEFEALGYSGDAGSLFKYVSADGVNWTKVGDSSDATGMHSFNLAPGGSNETFFRVQTGNTAGVYEGLHLSNFAVHCGTVTEPPDDGVMPPPFHPPGERAPEPATLSLLAFGGLLFVIGRR